MERFIATNTTPQKKEAARREGPETPTDSPALDLSDAAVKKLICTAKKRGYGSREPRFPPAGRASGVDLTFAIHLAANPRGECQIQNPLAPYFLVVL